MAGSKDSPQRKRVETAFEHLLEALGVEKLASTQGAAARAAHLWVDILLAGQGVDAAETLAGATNSPTTAPVSVFDIGVHMVCPHHLTVAFGHVHVAYAPAGRIVGFGALSRLAQICTARFALQEEATQMIVDTLVTHLDAKAACCVVEAVHPCHNATQPRAHDAKAITWATAGESEIAVALRETILFGRRPHV